MNLYLVTHYLENGHNLAVVIAAPSAYEARAIVRTDLAQSSVSPKGFNWQDDETRVELIKSMETERI